MDEGFNAFYQDLLHQEVATNWPESLRAEYEPVSCLSVNDTSGIFIVSRRADGMKGILRISAGQKSEDAAAEYRILCQLNDPRIPQALFFLEEQGTGYLVRQYMEGQTLREYVERHGVLGEKEIIGIALSICDILSLLHNQSPPIIHRDIKPENIIIAPDGGIQLVDFGIARIFRENATSDTVAIGTRPYMAPEQFGGTQTDARSDLYSLGVVMIFLATLKHDRTNIAQRFPYARLAPVVSRLVKADPEARYQNAAELRRALLYVQRGGRRRVMWGLAGAVLLAALIFVGYAIGHRSGHVGGVLEGKVLGSEEGYLAGVEEGKRLGYAQRQEESRLEHLKSLDESATLYFDDTDEPRGNQPGNLLHGGLVVMDKEHIYYAGETSIVRTAHDGTSVSNFCDMAAASLNIWENALYFIAQGGIWRAALADGVPELLVDTQAESLIISGGRLYYRNRLDVGKLYTADLNGATPRKVSEERPLFYLNIQRGMAYFASDVPDTNVRKLYRMDLSEGNAKAVLLYDGDAHWLQVQGDYLYFIRYTPRGSVLSRMRLDGSERMDFEGLNVRIYNATDRGIFYADSISGDLRRVSLDGKTVMTVSPVHANSINIAGDWVFYLDTDRRLHRMGLDGANNLNLQD
ncbi:MAG: protein kinase domain-containing protein [Christensenellales bacterium]